MRTTIGVIVVAVILIGLPLLALTGGRRLPLPRTATIPEDPASWLLRAAGISGRDHRTIIEAVARGQVVEPRLRSAAVGYGERLEKRLARDVAARSRGWLRWLTVFVGIGAIAYASFVRFSVLPLVYGSYLVLYPTVLARAQRTKLSRVRKATERNGVTPPELRQ